MVERNCFCMREPRGEGFSVEMAARYSISLMMRIQLEERRREQQEGDECGT